MSVWNVEMCGVGLYMTQNTRSLLLDGLDIITNALSGVWCVVCAPIPAPGPSFPMSSDMRTGFCRFFFILLFF